MSSPSAFIVPTDNTQSQRSLPVPVFLLFNSDEVALDNENKFLHPDTTIVIYVPQGVLLRDLKRTIRAAIVGNRFGVQFPFGDTSLNLMRLDLMHLSVRWNGKRDLPRLEFHSDNDVTEGLDMMRNRGWVDFIHACVFVERNRFLEGPNVDNVDGFEDEGFFDRVVQNVEGNGQGGEGGEDGEEVDQDQER